MISRADFDAYNRDVENLVSYAGKQTATQIAAWIKINPDASIAECREMAKETMDGMVQISSESAATLAAEWYDKQARKAHAKLPEAITETTYNKETIDKVAHYQARKLIDGDIKGFADACAELVENQTKQNLNNTILANAKRDKKKGVRFARVSTGSETCAFCYMLASRGAVYHTREKAGEQNHYHRRCDCKIVPGFEDDKFAEIVEGYDPRGMYDRMKLMEKQTGLKFKNKEDLPALSREMKLRDKQWLMDGTIPEPSYASEAVREFKTRTKQASQAHNQELETVKAIQQGGFAGIFVQDEVFNEETRKIDGYADLESGLEMKTLTNAKSYNTINGYIKETSKRKKNAIALLFDNRANDLPDEVLIMWINQSRNFSKGSVYILSHNQQIRRIR